MGAASSNSRSFADGSGRLAAAGKGLVVVAGTLIALSTVLQWASVRTVRLAPVPAGTAVPADCQQLGSSVMMRCVTPRPLTGWDLQRDNPRSAFGFVSLPNCSCYAFSGRSLFAAGAALAALGLVWLATGRAASLERIVGAVIALAGTTVAAFLLLTAFALYNNDAVYEGAGAGYWVATASCVLGAAGFVAGSSQRWEAWFEY